MQAVPSQYGSIQRLAVTGLIVNAILSIAKLAGGVFGHSHALVADAVESMMDVFGSLVVIGGLRIAAQPPDREHPYGHGKAEPIATLFVAVILIGAGCGIAISSLREIAVPARAPAAFTLWVLISVVIVKESLYRVGRRLSRKTESGVALADAWHHRSDAITSLAAAIGISASLLGGPGWERADGIAALFASGVILYNAVRILRQPLHELMDTKPAGIVDGIRRVAQTNPDVRGVEKVLARKSGRQYLVDMHLEVDPDMTVHDAHEVAHRVKDAIRAQIPEVQDVLIHIEPHGQKVKADHEV